MVRENERDEKRNTFNFFIVVNCVRKEKTNLHCTAQPAASTTHFDNNTQVQLVTN